MWKVLIPIITSALLAWGAWSTTAITSSTPREAFDRHVSDDNERFERMQESIDNKMQKLIDHLIKDDE